VNRTTDFAKETPMSADRLSSLDIAFLCIDGAATPMHLGAVALFSARNPDAHRLAALVARRADALPRLRQRVRTELTGGARWEDDPTFDATQHVSTHHLAGEGPEPLTAHASRWLATPLAVHRPLWSAQIVTGLSEERFALLIKLHHALCDGTGAIELALGLLDHTPLPRPTPRTFRSPTAKDDSPLRTLWRGARATVEQAIGSTVESASIAGAMLRAARPYPLSPTVTTCSPRRRLGLVRLDLDDIRRVRKTHGGTTNDVVLALLAGAFRDWLVNRNDDPVRPLRALVPVSMRRRRGAEAGGNALSGYLCDLPVDTDSPIERLHAVTRTMNRNKQAGPWRGAGALPVLAEHLPGAVHRLATRTVAHAAPLLFDTVVTNVPLPNIPLALDGAPLCEVYPVVPLAPHQSVGCAVSTYQNGVYIGLHTGGDAVSGVGSLADAVTQSMAVLLQHCP
jgi:diacylglycerol O-acyltransferase